MMQNYTRRRVHECAWSCSAVGAKRYRDAYRRLLNCEKAAPASGGPASCEAVAGPGPSIFKQFWTTFPGENSGKSWIPIFFTLQFSTI